MPGILSFLERNAADLKSASLTPSSGDKDKEPRVKVLASLTKDRKDKKESDHQRHENAPKDSTTTEHNKHSTVGNKHSTQKSQRHDSFSMDALKRHSLGAAQRRQSHETKRKASPRPETPKALSIDLKVESPPLLFIGPATDPNGDNSTGALFSCQLQLDVRVPSVTLATYESRLVCLVKHTHPVEKHCADCITKTSELKKWTHVPEPRTYRHGVNSLPLQYLFQGNLPATVHQGGVLATVEYHLITIAKPTDGPEVRHDREIFIRRAIPPASEKHSVRIFPPTNLTVNVTLQPVVHPIGEIPVSMRMEGATEKRRDATLRWRLRKAIWRIEETHRMVSPACPKHAGKVGGEGKGVQHEDTRTVGSSELKDGWKSDPDAGRVELEFRAAVNPTRNPVCDIDAPNGLKITHALVLELVVAEEWAPRNRPSQITPTGAARILRTQFSLCLTERAGQGISWDMEMPPMYDDVPESPPGYSMGAVGELDAASMHELDLGDLMRGARPAPPPTFEEAAQARAAQTSDAVARDRLRRLGLDDIEEGVGPVAGPSRSRDDRDLDAEPEIEVQVVQ